LRQLVGQVSGFWPTLTQLLLLSLVLEVLVLVGPLLMQWILDHVLVSRDANLLGTLALGFLLLLVLQQGFSLARSWILLIVNASVRVQWRSNVVSHMLRLPLEYFQKRHLGDIVSRVGAVDEIQRVLTNAFVEGVFDGLLVVLTLVMMFVYSPPMAGVAVLAVLLYLGIRLLWLRPLYLATEEQIVRGAVQSTHLLETIRGMRAIKLFARQGERKSAWQTMLVAETNASLSIQKMQIFYRIVNSSLSGVIYIALLWMGTQQILGGALSIGMLMAFLAYRSQFDSRVSSLIDQLISYKMLKLYGERLADLVLTRVEPSGRRTSVADTLASPDIRLDAISFSYAPHEPAVLDGISLHINAGESLAITGASGGGKTTLVHMLLGVLNPLSGQIIIGGQPLAQYGVENWRRRVGSVMQDDTLFAGSIADNICFFDPKPDLAFVEECARLAAVHDEISRMPMTYQTLVGGQKQRVLLARALYKRPNALILDEATSHLDTRREAEVNQAIHGLAMTRIIVAHRAETIASTDRVIELVEGRIAFDGPTTVYLNRLVQARNVSTP
jgi:ATP-binding cassette subfamily B protein RaxB